MSEILTWFEPSSDPRLSSIVGGSDGVRTRDRPVKSRVLYLTKLQTQPADLAPLFNRNGRAVFSAQSSALVEQCDDPTGCGHHDRIANADKKANLDHTGDVEKCLLQAPRVVDC